MRSEAHWETNASGIATIVASKLGDDAGITGAAVLAQRETR